ncbi:MAG: IS1 family transposase [Candidatus Electronema sp. V4]|uniref:IS1 family transposase n=1 Tax=Candidatus Electronema sp. V4 TaxID=3454756 RepID=UPI0040559026
MDKLSFFPIIRWYADGWRSCSKYIPSEKYAAGKADTWKTERGYLNFRAHLKGLNRKLSISQMMKEYMTT